MTLTSGQMYFAIAVVLVLIVAFYMHRRSGESMDDYNGEGYTPVQKGFYPVLESTDTQYKKDMGRISVTGQGATVPAK